MKTKLPNVILCGPTIVNKLIIIWEMCRTTETQHLNHLSIVCLQLSESRFG